MGDIRDEANEVLRDYVTDGVPASGPHEPEKSGLRTLFGTVEDRIDQVAEGGGLVFKDTKALLDADLAHDADTYALVQFDSTDAQNGYYKKSGASGAGSWTFLGADPRVAAAADAEAAAAEAEGFKDDAEAAAATAAAAASPAAVLPACVTHFYPCDEGAGDTLRDVMGGTDIDISGVTGAVWANGVLTLTSDHFLTPSITARAMFMVLRNVVGASTGYVMASPGGKAIGQALSGGTSFTSVRSLSGFGVHTLKARTDAGGSSAHELNSGGWVAPLATLTSDETGTFVIGAATTGGAGEASFFEIAAIGFCDASPTDDEAKQLRGYLARVLGQRSIYITHDDCPRKAELVVVPGESTSEGTMPLTGLSTDERATHSQNTFVLAFNSASQNLTGRRMTRLRFGATNANNNAPSVNTKFGLEWGLMLAQNERADYGLPLHVLKVAQGQTYSLPSGDYTDATGSPVTIGTSVSRNAVEFTSTTSGLHYGLEMRNFLRQEAQARNEGVGYASVTFIENDGLNDAYIGDNAITSAAQYQGYMQDRYDARSADYGIANVQQIQIYPHTPEGGVGGGDADYPAGAVGESRLAALTFIRSGMAAFVAANSANVSGLDSNDFTRYPLNNESPNTDWVHWSKTGYENIGIDAHALIPFDVAVVGT